MAKFKILIADFEMEAEGSEDAIRSAFEIAGMLMRGELPKEEPRITDKPKTRRRSAAKARKSR